MIDCVVLVAIAATIAGGKEDINEIFTKLAPIMTPDLHYTSVSNVLSVLIEYTSPLTHPTDQIYNVAKNFLQQTMAKPSSSQDLSETQDSPLDIEEFCTWIRSKCELNDDNCEQTADDMVARASFRAGSSYDEALYAFIKCKIVHDAPYFDYMKDDLQLLPLIGCDPYTTWHHGVIEPYLYYHKNSPKHSKSSHTVRPVSFSSYLHPDFDRFALFAESTTDAAWISNTVLPSVKYNGDTSRLVEWLLANDDGIVARYKLWNVVIAGLSTDHFLLDVIMHKFIARCYYDAFYGRVPAVDTIKVYDSIARSLWYSPASKEHINPDDALNYKELDLALLDSNSQISFDQFESHYHSLINKPALLAHIVAVCLRLFAYNQLTIAQYLRLKAGATPNVEPMLLAVSRTNHSKVAEAVHSYIDEFVKDSSIARDLQMQFAQRCLEEGIYERSVYSGVDVGALVRSRAWDIIDSSTSLKDRSLQHVGDSLALVDEGSERSLRHFVAVLDHLRPFNLRMAPRAVARAQPLTLVRAVLEQNPRAYSKEKVLLALAAEVAEMNESIADEKSKVDKSTSGNISRGLSVAVVVLCIEFGAAQGDFDYAYGEFVRVVKSDPEEAAKHWRTFVKIAEVDTDDRIELEQQRHLLSVVLGMSGVDSLNVLKQWQRINDRLTAHSNAENEHFLEEDSAKIEASVNNVLLTSMHNGLGSNLASITNSTQQNAVAAGDKLSNLFVSGLGWAIGANQT